VATLRPELGPGLPDLLAARLRWPVRRTRGVLLALFATLVLVQATRIVLSRGAGLTNDAIVSLKRVTPRAGEALRLVSAPGAKTYERFTVAPLRLAPYTGDPAGILPVIAAREVGRLRASFREGFRYRGDGRTRINEIPGHQLLFQTRIGGRLYYGKRYFLLTEVEPPAQSRQGVVITVLARYSKTTPSIDAIGAFGQTKGPLRSFRFGTERP